MRSTAIALLLATALGSAACAEDDVGIKCALQVPAERTASETLMIGNAVDCRSRICALFGNAPHGVCTQTCGDDSDCPDADPDLCPLGYACIIGQTSGQALKCCKMCACKGTNEESWLTFNPTSGTDPNAAACEGVPTNSCPSL